MVLKHHMRHDRLLHCHGGERVSGGAWLATMRDAMQPQPTN